MLHLYAVQEIQRAIPVAVGARNMPQFLTAWTYPLVLLSAQWDVRPAWEMMAWPSYVAPGLAFSGAWTVLLVALPQSRRRAKLQFGHVLRGAVYGLSWVVILVLYRMFRNVRLATVEGLHYLEVAGSPNPPALAWRVEPVAYLSESGPIVDLMCAGLLFGWVSVWWLCAITRGWRMHLGWLIWLLGLIVASLCALVARAYLPNGLA